MVQFVQCERASRADSVLVTDTFFVPKNTDYIYRDNRTGRLPYLLHCSKYNTTSTVISDIERRNGSFFSFAETKVLNFSPSVSVRLFHLATASHCCGFAAVGPVATKSVAARRLAAAAPQHGAQQQIWGAARCQLT